MKMNIISRGKSIGTPLSKFRETRFSLLKKNKRTKENQFKKASHALSQVTILYRRINWQ